MARNHAASPADNGNRFKGGITMDMSGRDDGRRFEMSGTQEDGSVRTGSSGSSGGGGGGKQEGHPPKPETKSPKK